MWPGLSRTIVRCVTNDDDDNDSTWQAQERKQLRLRVGWLEGEARALHAMLAALAVAAAHESGHASWAVWVEAAALAAGVDAARPWLP